jgi:hypothetical protein
MSHAMLLQDWLTLNGPAAATVIQNESHWAKVEGYQDACFYLELGGSSAAAAGTFLVQTSPTKDANFFDAFASGSSPGSIASFSIAANASGVQSLKVSRWATETVQPLSRFLRWKMVFGASGGSLTFRLWVTLNQAGY